MRKKILIIAEDILGATFHICLSLVLVAAGAIIAAVFLSALIEVGQH